MTVIDKLNRLEQEAMDFGFKWETTDQIKDQILSEIAEIDVHLHDQDRSKLQEELGDLLHAVFSLTVFCGFNPQETLSMSADKFEKRFLAVKQIAAQKGLNTLNGLNFDELMAIWAQAKAFTPSTIK